jgi:hypothetical protein
MARDGAIRVGGSDLSSPFTFTADPAFEVALTNGVDALKQHLSSLAKRSIDDGHRRIGETADTK